MVVFFRFYHNWLGGFGVEKEEFKGKYLEAIDYWMGLSKGHTNVFIHNKIVDIETLRTFL